MGNCVRDAQDIQVQAELDAARRAQLKDHKLLLLGAGSSGKSTFFKQLCRIHGGGLQAIELDQARQNIYACIIDQMKQLVEQCFENIRKPKENDDYDYTLSPEIKAAAEYLLSPKIPRGGSVISEEHAQLIHTLWDDPAIKHTFETRSNLGVVDSAPHFFRDIDRISEPDYKPTEEDILLVRIPTTGTVQSLHCCTYCYSHIRILPPTNRNKKLIVYD